MARVDPNHSRGVSRAVNRKARPWNFQLCLGDLRTSVGGYATKKAAAIARDRAVLFYKCALALNYPSVARTMGAASLEALRAEVRASRKARAVSRYRGVAVAYDRVARWAARIVVDAQSHELGYYARERDAAIAYDRAALFFHGRSVTRNFPERALAPASPEQLRAEQHARLKRRTTSRYVGVYWCAARARWCAQIMVDGRRYSLGAYEDEIGAARAYERAARKLR